MRMGVVHMASLRQGRAQQEQRRVLVSVICQLTHPAGQQVAVHDTISR